MPEIILFAGPSITGVDSALLKPVDLRPPVQQGDVYLAAQEAPGAIAIIDGFFEGAPAVWHKEILWALTRGIAVLGASSMGALRAAEMERFGMQGFGGIFEAYRDGVLEDDDEVALLHGPADLGYPNLSLAMVNARATLAAASAAGLIEAAEEAALVASAKAQFYKIRSWDSVLSDPAAPRLGDSRLADLRHWIATHAVDQKRLDAEALLQHLAQGAPAPARTETHFEETALWHEAVGLWRQRAAAQARATAEKGGYRLTAGLSLLQE
ncbi:TfuA-like protein [uncultured Roseobacter sp.]|uniref:TfuA-like protein n=1 Tax=uncultured Roseobacter sp. TaxID=114847 RepID=UPI00262A53FD|nr:TfuA-like protein [uncultured Roseobacter sp.]